MIKTRMYRSMSRAILFMCLALACWTDSSFALEFGEWTHSPSEAKILAQTHNRPILVVIGGTSCTHCIYLENILFSGEMADYAKANQLVLFESMDVWLCSRLGLDFARACGMYTALPYVFLFKVKEDVPRGELEADDTFRPEHVSLLEISSGPYAGRKSGMNYQSQEVINGIVLENETELTLNTFIKVIESFFPNKQYPSGERGWASIKPETGPTGYEDAIDLGRIANPDHPADSGPGWIAYGPTATFSGSESEHWYKFTGDAGKRYFCMAKDFHDHDNPIAVALYASSASGADKRPLDPPIFTANSTGFDALERGLCMDIPAEGGNNQLFYLRLSHSGGSADTGLPYSLKVHETRINPAVGSVTNPRWRGAQKGQWTMDADKAKELAAAEGAPLIYYFTGVLWCPYCVGMDHLVLSSDTFKASTQNAYLVLLDNRQRNDCGPSLLLDNRPNGYLTSNKISAAAATMQLAGNLMLQDALALPDASTADWSHGRRIGYPTLLYCKVGADAGLAGVTPIGRFSYQTFVDQPDAKQAKAFIEELARLADKGHREANASPQTSPLQLPAQPGTEVEKMIGGLAHGNWFKFSVSEEQAASAWVFDAQASQDAEAVKMIDAAAQIELIVYDAAGQTLLRRAQDSLKEGCRLEFVPPSAKGGQYWLAVKPIGQPRAVPFTLSYELEKLNYSVALAHDELAVAATDTSIVLPLLLTTRQANEQPLRFEYRIRCPEGSPQASYFATPNSWQLAEWSAEEKASGHKELSLPLAVPAGESWSGSRDVVVELRDVANGNCRITSSGEKCTVKIFSQAFFARPVADAYGLFANEQRDLSFRIRKYDAQNHTVSATGLPTGLGWELQVPGARGTDIDLRITGKPTKDAVDEHSVTLEIRGNDDALLDQLALTITILDLAGTIADRDSYAGHISPDDSGLGAPLGSLLLRKRQGSSDLYLTLHSTSTKEALEAAVHWQGNDPAKGQYSLSHRWEKEQAEIVLTLDSAGIGRGTFTAPSGEEQAVFFAPVTENPAAFSGIYHVVLHAKPAKPPHARDGYALGWLTLTVYEDGTAFYSGELIDGTNFTSRTAATEEANGNGRVVFFAPLNWDPEPGRYQGRLAGQLAIAPKFERHKLGPPPNPACVADCSNALWARSATEQDPIQPCGATYQAGMTLAEQAGLTDPAQDFLLEIQPTAQNERTVVPDWIALYERRDGGALLPRHDNLLTNKNIFIVIDAATGVINGSMNVLSPEYGQPDQPLVPTPVELRGLLSPITSACCSAGSDLFLGYGYFIWNGTSYAFRIGAPENVEQNPTPALISNVSPFGQGKATITIQSPSKRMLYQHQGSDKLYLADWSDSPKDSIELALATGTTWHFVALSQPQDEDKKLPSEPLLLAIYGTSSGDAGLALQPGWNLIGVPDGKRYTVVSSNPTPTCFGYAADRRCYTRTTNLRGGGAYWLFATAEDCTVTFVQTEEQLTVKPRPYAWSLLARPSERLPFSFDQPTWYWNGQSYSITPPANGTATSAWFYLESILK